MACIFFTTKDKIYVSGISCETGGESWGKEENDHSGAGFSHDRPLLIGQRTNQSALVYINSGQSSLAGIFTKRDCQWFRTCLEDWDDRQHNWLFFPLFSATKSNQIHVFIGSLRQKNIIESSFANCKFEEPPCVSVFRGYIQRELWVAGDTTCLLSLRT